MTVLSLDQASKVSGYAVFTDTALTTYGHFEFDDPDIGIRLHQIRNKVKELIDKYNPDYVVFEDIQQQENVQTFKTLAQVQGVIFELLTELRIPHSVTLASVWKSALNIKGKNRTEQKRNAQAYVVGTYGIKVTQDAADAVCIGEAYLKATKCAWS